MGLHEGERVSLHDLLYGLLLPSGNDAGIAIAEHVGGSVAGFARLMNARAAALHLTHTHYLNPYGFFRTSDGDDPRQYTSARDLVELTRYALRYPLFRQIVATKHHRIPATRYHHAFDLSTVDYVLEWYPGADGVKPGWTRGAGICQVVDVERGGRHLILALLHTTNLYTDTRDLLNYGLDDFTWVPSPWSAVDRLDQAIAGTDGFEPFLYYPYTGHTVRGAVLTFFRAHGGLQVFGFPRTEVVDVAGQLEQFFTNQVLSYDPRWGTVAAQPLGVRAVPDRGWLRPIAPVPATGWRTYYPETGHSVTYRFRQCYLALGGSDTLGYPVTEKRVEGAQLVQYFEDAEFIWHPTTGNDGYITLAPFGQDRLAALHLLPGQALTSA
jgi:hypothetical protein